MSKTSKAASKQKNLEAKRKIRAANRAKYESLRNSGQNSKSLRARKNAKRSRKNVGVSHPEGPCGNIGCSKCNPNFTPFLVKPQKKIKKMRIKNLIKIKKAA